jgi:CRISP-associated protein Cas1
MILCGANQSPFGFLWPSDGHYEQGKRMEALAKAGQVLKNRLWQQLITAKIMAQAAVIETFHGKDAHLERLCANVFSGDKDNKEAQAARIYWPKLMGADFVRDRGQQGINAALNYGYTILRSAAARSIIASGLLPSLSIYHASRGESLRLADDIMEPFRPYVDWIVYGLHTQNLCEELTPQIKAALVNVLCFDVPYNDGAHPLQIGLDKLCTSLAAVFMGETQQLILPRRPTTAELRTV